MNIFETISIDVYPWAVPTEEQRSWFDALKLDEKRKTILAAIEEGFSSPEYDRSVSDILRELRSEQPDPDRPGISRRSVAVSRLSGTTGSLVFN